jgi:hypothetical protein
MQCIQAHKTHNTTPGAHRNKLKVARTSIRTHDTCTNSTNSTHIRLARANTRYTNTIDAHIDAQTNTPYKQHTQHTHTQHTQNVQLTHTTHKDRQTNGQTPQACKSALATRTQTFTHFSTHTLTTTQPKQHKRAAYARPHNTDAHTTTHTKLGHIHTTLVLWCLTIRLCLCVVSSAGK